MKSFRVKEVLSIRMYFTLKMYTSKPLFLNMLYPANTQEININLPDLIDLE